MRLSLFSLSTVVLLAVHGTFVDGALRGGGGHRRLTCTRAQKKAMKQGCLPGDPDYDKPTVESEDEARAKAAAASGAAAAPNGLPQLGSLQFGHAVPVSNSDEDVLHEAPLKGDTVPRPRAGWRDNNDRLQNDQARQQYLRQQNNRHDQNDPPNRASIIDGQDSYIVGPNYNTFSEIRHGFRGMNMHKDENKQLRKQQKQKDARNWGPEEKDKGYLGQKWQKFKRDYRYKDDKFDREDKKHLDAQNAQNDKFNKNRKKKHLNDLDPSSRAVYDPNDPDKQSKVLAVRHHRGKNDDHLAKMNDAEREKFSQNWESQQKAKLPVSGREKARIKAEQQREREERAQEKALIKAKQEREKEERVMAKKIENEQKLQDFVDKKRAADKVVKIGRPIVQQTLAKVDFVGQLNKAMNLQKLRNKAAQEDYNNQLMNMQLPGQPQANRPEALKTQGKFGEDSVDEVSEADLNNPNAGWGKEGVQEAVKDIQNDVAAANTPGGDNNNDAAAAAANPASDKEMDNLINFGDTGFDGEP